MNVSRAMIALLSVAGACLPLGAATSAPLVPGAMVTGSVTSQPIGHYEFCQLNKSECSIRTREAGPAKLTEHGWGLLRDINASVNAAIAPMTDKDIYGREEVWASPVDAGDCEDFVLLKRRQLMDAGFVAADLLITVVRKPDGEGHAVLTVRTTEGDYVMDNLEDEVRPWFDTSYTFLKRQASFDTGRWVTIENGRDLLVGALN